METNLNLIFKQEMITNKNILRFSVYCTDLYEILQYFLAKDIIQSNLNVNKCTL